MTKIALPFTAIIGAILVLLLHAAPAQAATSTRTWVASDGTNNVTCGRTTPCQTFDQAHTATTAGGEINCVDAGEYGSVTITKSISIICDNTKAGILFSSGEAINVNAGASDIVTLTGLDIDGAGTGSIGIRFQAGAILHVHKVQIRNFRGGNGIGIAFTPPAYAELYVADSYITDNGIAGSPSGGIVIQATGTGSANVFIDRVKLENNSTGIFVDGGFSTVAVNAVVRDSVVTGSAGNGITASTTAGHAAVSVVVDGTNVATNFGTGINANGATASGAGSAIVRIGDSVIVNNVTGVSTTGAGPGVVQSFKDNMIAGNSTDGTPLTAFPGPGGTPLQ